MYSIIPSANECFCNFPVCSTALGFNLQYCPYLHGNPGSVFSPPPVHQSRSFSGGWLPLSELNCRAWGDIIGPSPSHSVAFAWCKIFSEVPDPVDLREIVGSLGCRGIGQEVMWIFSLAECHSGGRLCGRLFAEGIDTTKFCGHASRVRMKLECLSRKKP